MRKAVLGSIAGIVMGAMLLAPASAHITTSVKHDWKHLRKLAKKLFYTKGQVYTKSEVDAKLAETPETGSVSVDRHAFFARETPDTDGLSPTLTRGANGACPSGNLPLSAPVQLPDGVTVTSFTVYWYDTNDLEPIVVNLLATRHADDAETILGSIGSTGMPGDGVNTQTLATPHVVDNAQFAYQVATGTINNNLCVRSAVIGYTT